jgi:hypothetical protein
MIISLDIEIWEIGESGTKRGGQEKGWVDGGRGKGAAGFCGLCVCSGVFLL